MTSSTPPLRGAVVAFIILAVIGAGSAVLTFVALALGELDQARAFGVIAALSVSGFQTLAIWQGMKIFNIWRRQQSEWIKEWGLIQQELGRRREQGGWS